MRTSIVLTALLTSSFIHTPVAMSEEDGREIVEKAMRSRSAKVEKLVKQRVEITNLQGKIFKDGTFEFPTTKTVLVEWPSRVRWNLEMTTPQGKSSMVMCLNNNGGWNQIGGDMPTEISLTDADEFKMELYGRWLGTLYPLKDSSYSLTRLKDSTFNDEELAVVKASQRGRQDVILSFSKKSGHLVKIAYFAREKGVKIRKEHHYSDYKDFDGLLLPGKEIDMRQTDQENTLFKAAEWTITSRKFVDKLDSDLFEPPVKK